MKEILIKQTDEIERILSEKFCSIENLIESTKKSISQMQYEAAAANSCSKDANDVSFSCRRVSTTDKLPLATQNLSLRRRKV